VLSRFNNGAEFVVGAMLGEVGAVVVRPQLWRPPGSRELPGGGKDQAIESLRGLAIILVVIGHAIGISADRGLQAAPDSVWRILYLALVDVRLPLFTMISGYVYALRPVSTQSGLGAMLKAKVRRVLVPLVTVGTLLFVMQMLVPGTNANPKPADYGRIFLFGFEHLWFLQAIFVAFVIVGLLDAFGLLNTPVRAIAAFVVSLAIFEFVPVPRAYDYFSASGVVRLLPFFILGYIFARYPMRSKRLRIALSVAIPVLIVTYGLRYAAIFGAVSLNIHADRAVSAAIGITAVLILFAAREKLRSRVLAWGGAFAFGIYLLHPFGTSGARIFMHGLGINSNLAVFTVGVICGLAFPILVEISTARSRAIHTCIFGEKWPKSAKPAKPAPKSAKPANPAITPANPANPASPAPCVADDPGKGEAA
jgi:peptidoglycan/LPS O-acetylase OafA/YrhL